MYLELDICPGHERLRSQESVGFDALSADRRAFCRHRRCSLGTTMTHSTGILHLESYRSLNLRTGRFLAK